MNQIENKNYYYSRINKSLDYINKNLEKEIKIEQLAKLSNFSSYHFQRIFKALTGESPYESLFRLRLEKSVFLLKYRSKLSIKTIAFQSGFLSPENFSRQFKARYKISPSRFRNDKIIQNSRIYQVINPNDFFLCINSSKFMGTVCSSFSDFVEGYRKGLNVE